MTKDSRRTVVSWALHDWGNSAFVTTVMAGFFVVVVTAHAAFGRRPTESPEARSAS